MDKYISNPNYQPSVKHIPHISGWRKVLRFILKIFLYSLPVIVFAFPFVVLISRSFFTLGESVAYSEGLGIFPKKWSIEAYQQIFQDEELRQGLLTGLRNTTIIVICNVIGIPLTAFMSAYAFTKIKFKFRKIIFAVALGTIMIPGILLMVPVYQIFLSLGWVGRNNTLLPLTIPCFFGGGIINIFMIMQFIRSIPKEIDEAAIIDGAPLPVRMFRITLPLIKPIIIYLMVICFFGAWNDFSGALMYLRDPEVYTLNLFIFYRFFGTDASTDAVSAPNVQMAIGVLMMIPMFVIYVIFQKQLVEGLTFGAVKE